METRYKFGGINQAVKMLEPIGGDLARLLGHEFGDTRPNA